MQDLLKIHLAVLFFGFAGLFGKFIDLPAQYIVLGRVFFASISIGIYFLITKKDIRLVRKADYVAICAVGSMLAFHWTAFYLSVKLSTVAIAVLTFAAYPIFVTFLEPIFFREKLRAADVFAALIMFVGVVLVVPNFNAGEGMLAGMIWGMIGSLSFAVMSLLNRKFVSRYDGSVVTFYQQSSAALTLLPLLVLFDRPHATITDYVLIVILGVVLTGLAQSLFISGMKSVRAQTAGVIAGLESVYGIALAALCVGEIPALRELTGGIIILGTAFISTMRSSHESSYNNN